MTHNADDRILAALMDPSLPPEPEIEAIERHLRRLAFDPASHALNLTTRPMPVQRRLRRWTWVAAAAAVVVLLLAGTLAVQWRFSWPDGRAWSITASEPAVVAPPELAVGDTLTVPADGQTTIDVARIGTMRVEGGSEVTLRSTQGTRHRLRLDNGSVHIRVWAPPGSVAFQTPAGEVIDLGCEFDLQVTRGMSRVIVRSGWVQLDNAFGESLIPAGAIGEMRLGEPPAVPVVESAVPAFRQGVTALEREGDPSTVQTVVLHARVEDVLTLLMLIDRGSAGADRLAARAADLWPPPRDVTVGQVVRGDRDALWRWRDTLPLPPPKGWLRNWEDALPRWMVSGSR